MPDQSAKIKCLVVGNSASGTVVASRLKILGFEPYFVGRRGVSYIKSRLEAWGEITYLEVMPLNQINIADVEVVFMAVRIYDLVGALERYLAYIPKGIPIIPLCSGAIEDLIWGLSKKYPAFIWRMGLCTFDVTEISRGIYNLKQGSGAALWGNVEQKEQSFNSLTQVEKDIFAADREELFQWNQKVQVKLRHHWLFDMVTSTICGAKGYTLNGQLLSDMSTLSQVFDESFLLGQELWGAWDVSKHKLLEELVGKISLTAATKNSMTADIRAGQRTENAYLAKLAENRRGYELLTQFSKEIESKNKKKSYA